MNLNYEGFEEEFFFEFNRLFDKLNDTYKEVTGYEFDIKNNKFLNEITDKSFDVDGKDREGMLSMALVIMQSSNEEASVVRLFQNYRLAMALSIYTESDISKEFFDKKIKSEAAKVRWQLDPRNTEKAFIKECWLDWKRVRSKYSSKAEFARDMLDKSQHLTSTKVIEDWCREWDKEKA
jgi:hypothetical protein